MGQGTLQKWTAHSIIIFWRMSKLRVRSILMFTISISKVYLKRSKSFEQLKTQLSVISKLDLKCFRIQWYCLPLLKGHFIKWNKVKCSIHILRGPWVSPLLQSHWWFVDPFYWKRIFNGVRKESGYIKKNIKGNNWGQRGIHKVHLIFYTSFIFNL